MPTNTQTPAHSKKTTQEAEAPMPTNTQTPAESHASVSKKTTQEAQAFTNDSAMMIAYERALEHARAFGDDDMQLVAAIDAALQRRGLRASTACSDAADRRQLWPPESATPPTAEEAASLSIAGVLIRAWP